MLSDYHIMIMCNYSAEGRRGKKNPGSQVSGVFPEIPQQHRNQTNQNRTLKFWNDSHFVYALLRVATFVYVHV